MTRADLALGQMTHVGMERSVNQDYYGYFEPEDDETFARLGRLIVVCDGMGGHAGGEIASQLATETIIESYSSSDGADLAAALKKAIEDANAAVWARAEAEPELKGMGTTAVALVLHDGQAIFAHVGDSRAYRVRGGVLDAMTLDHSLVQKWVNDGVIQEDAMEDHEEKNVILRSVGVLETVEVDVSTHPYEADDIYILSSDGLTGLVSKDECLQVALHYKDTPAHAAAYLVQMANQYGGYDNVTVQVARVRAVTVAEAEQLPPLPDPNAPAEPQGLEAVVAAAHAAAAQALAAATEAAYAASTAAQSAAAAAHAAQAAAGAVGAIVATMVQQAEAQAAEAQASAETAEAVAAEAVAAEAVAEATSDEAAVGDTTEPVLEPPFAEETPEEAPAGGTTEPPTDAPAATEQAEDAESTEEAEVTETEPEAKAETGTSKRRRSPNQEGLGKETSQEA